jgi:hypothetical protein
MTIRSMQMVDGKPVTTEFVWAGEIDWRHLAILSENEKFLGIVKEKLAGLGYTDPEFCGISPVTNTIEDLVVEFQTNATKDGVRARHAVHVKMKGYEVSIH